MGAWETYCLVCAGPSSHCEVVEEMYAPGLLAALGKAAWEFEWLNNHLGIPGDNVPRQLGERMWFGIWSLPASAARFHPAQRYDMAINYGVQDLYGLKCHAACYTFLHERLGYKLEFQDLWPVLYPEKACTGSSMMLDSDYGGMTKYHDQVTKA